MFVTHYRSLRCKSLHVPKLYCHIRCTWCQDLAILVESKELYNSWMSLQGPLVLTLLEVPKSNSGVFRGWSSNIIEGVQNYLSYFSPMTLHSVLFWLSGQSISHLVWASTTTTKGLWELFTPFAGGTVLYLLNLLFKVPNLLFQPGQWGPFLLQDVNFGLVNCSWRHRCICLSLKMLSCFDVLIVHQILNNCSIQFFLLLSCKACHLN